MSSPFTPRSNVWARATLLLLLAVAIGAPVMAMAWVRSPYARGVGADIAQPMPFDHRIHAADLQIDCRFCHYTVERSSTAGMPSTRTCVPCHNRPTLDSRLFAAVNRSLDEGTPIPWRRVTWLPDFVYFDHSIHVNKGVGCETCHGRVDRMARVAQVVPLTMAWCLDCHRTPDRYLRPVEAMTTMGWRPSGDSVVLGARLARAYDVHALVNCTACHR